MVDSGFIPDNVLQSILHAINSGRTLTSVLVGVYVWEIMTTVHLEYKLIWRKKVSFVTFAYLVSRYWTLAAFSVILWLMYIPVSLWSNVCPKMVMWIPIAPVPAMAAANFIMATRLYAVSGQSKIVAAVCGIFICFIVAIQIAGPLLNDPLYTVIPPQLQTSICVPNAQGVHQWSFVLYSLSITAYDVFALAVVTWTSRTNWRQSPSVIVKVLVRDQVTFFLLCTVCTAINSIYFLAADQDKAQLAPLPVIMQSIAICRIVLNLRKVAESSDSTSLSIQANYASYLGTRSGSGSIRIITCRHQAISDTILVSSTTEGFPYTKEDVELSSGVPPPASPKLRTPPSKMPTANTHRQHDPESLEKQPVNTPI